MSKKISTTKNYCILFSTKNDIELIENLLFEKSAANFNDILMLNVDANSNKKQLAISDKVCKKNNIHWINKEDLISGIPMQNNIKLADDWLTNNNIDVDWILHFDTDCYPTIENFWEKLDYYLEKYSSFKETVGMFGFRVQGSKFGRGCLLQEILDQPYEGWYKADSITQLEYEKPDYFVAEVPNWCAAGINRELFRKHIDIDNNYNSTDKEHKIFRDKWKFWWGVRNKNLRQEFNEAWEFYSGTIQEKLFMLSMSDGPKTIADIEKLD